MYKIILWIVALVLVVGGGYFLLSKKSEASGKPWVEVGAGKAFLVDEDAPSGKITLTPLRTGDEVSVGDVVTTDEKGIATIYFPDGSNLRLSENTRLLITESSAESDGTLKVRAYVFAGKVWSKVLGLSTTESVWEIESSTAVATVRGTAFGFWVSKDDTSDIVGSENKVALMAKNPETGERMKETETIVEPEDVVDVTKDEAKKMASLDRDKEKTEVSHMMAKNKFASESDELKIWAGREIVEDKKIDERIKKLENQGLERKEAVREFNKEIKEKRKEILGKRSELREEAQEKIEEGDKAELEKLFLELSDFKEEMIDVREKEGIIDIGEKELDTEFSKENEEVAPINRTESTNVSQPKTTESVPGGSVSTAKPISLAIIPRVAIPALGIPMGQKVAFRAVFTLADGTKKDAPLSEIKWSVSGPIGRIVEPGVLLTNIPIDEQELGEVTGTVTGTLVGPDGIQFTSKSPQIKVIMPIIEDDDALFI